MRASREAKSLDTPVDQSGSPDAADSPALVDTLAADLGDAAEDSSQRCARNAVHDPSPAGGVPPYRHKRLHACSACIRC